MEHTPDPWTAESGQVVRIRPDGIRDVIASRYSWNQYSEDGETHTEDRHEPGICPVEADANCRLMAAAPKLLGLLLVVSKRLEIEEQVHPGGVYLLAAFREEIADAVGGPF